MMVVMMVDKKAEQLVEMMVTLMAMMTVEKMDD